MNTPKHVAIILDGNGRWAKKRGLPRNVGHSQGSRAVEKICEDAWNLGIHYLTVYAFSTENWNRPDQEVAALMKLLRNYMKTSIKRSMRNNMKVRVIGDKTALDDDLREDINKLEEATKDNTGLHFQIAINYGSRNEIIRGVKKLYLDIKEGKEEIDNISESLFDNYLDTHGIPDPDLLIRTSGELRVSNFLLWQLAYTEFYFTDVLWPDFNKKELQKAIEYYDGRNRRFGKTEEQVDV